VQLANPELSSRFCQNALISCETRAKLIDTYAETQVIVIPAHFPTPTAGRIERNGDAFHYNIIDRT
jgi:hypothetical protein